MQLFQGGEDRHRVVDEDQFRDLDLQPAGLKTRRARGVDDRGDEIFVGQLNGRQVDRDSISAGQVAASAQAVLSTQSPNA